MTWYVEAVGRPETVATTAAQMRRTIRGFAATMPGVTSPASDRRKVASAATVERLVQISPTTWATLNIDVAPGAHDPTTSRVNVWGCFWGGLDNQLMTAPPAADREACQLMVDELTAALHAHIARQASKKLSGREIN